MYVRACSLIVSSSIFRRTLVPRSWPIVQPGWPTGCGFGQFHWAAFQGGSMCLTHKIRYNTNEHNADRVRRLCDKFSLHERIAYTNWSLATLQKMKNSKRRVCFLYCNCIPQVQLSNCFIFIFNKLLTRCQTSVWLRLRQPSLNGLLCAANDSDSLQVVNDSVQFIPCSHE